MSNPQENPTKEVLRSQRRVWLNGLGFLVGMPAVGLSIAYILHTYGVGFDDLGFGNPAASDPDVAAPKGGDVAPERPSAPKSTPSAGSEPQEVKATPEVADGVKEVRAKGGYWSQFAPSTPGDAALNLAQLERLAHKTDCYGTYEGVTYRVWESENTPGLYHYIPVRG